jgi:putative RNA 2'-phosphotransferase
VGHKKTSDTSIKESAAAARRARLEKELLALLRRQATAAGLAMDPAGWVRIEDVLPRLDATRSVLSTVVANSNLGDRAIFDVAGSRIRAHEGHWPRSVPVKLAALEASWDPFIPNGPLWHGTTQAKLRRIAVDGVVPGHRSHVRLETNAESKHLGGSDVLLEVSPRRLFGQGLNIYRARNGVVLVRRIPLNAIVGSVPTPRNRRHFEADLQALLEG